MSIRISGSGSYLPEKILTNLDLQGMVDTSDEWIRSRTGIEVRHIASEDEAASNLGERAARQALTNAGIDADMLDLIIVSTTTPDYSFPSTACCLQERINAGKAFCFDISAACSGFIYALDVASALLKCHAGFRYALVCASEKLSDTVDWSDRNTCVLFGDGAGAVILEKIDDGNDALPLSVLSSDGKYNRTLIRPGGGSRLPVKSDLFTERLQCIQMSGKETFKLAVNSMVNSSRQVLERAHLSAADLSLVIPHQANRRIIQAVADRLGLNDCQVVDVIDRCANISSATIPFALDDCVRNGRVKRGDLLLFTAFGSGLTWGAYLIRY